MLKIELTNTIKKDLKKYRHQKEVLFDLQNIIELLAQKKSLPAKNRDHYLTGNWASYRECHVKNDALLIYKIEDETLFLTRFGSHSELF
ncbi:MAG: type II toxin-antitoxin system YafQ family toxin [Parachlamydiaceae bacterium]